MPRSLLSSRVPVDLSILEFDPALGEELFLSFASGREQGPPIIRSGISPPHMQRIGGQQGEITHPFAMRAGSWLIRDQMAENETKDAGAQLQEAVKQKIEKRDLSVLEEMERELHARAVQSHERWFRQTYSGLQVLGLQGCGDLTMNAWKVAFLNKGLGRAQETLVYLHQEPLDDRTYSCLVKWRSEGAPRRVTIEEVAFKRDLAADPNDRVQVRFGGDLLPRADVIELAVSSQQVIRDGEIVPVVTTCHQFGDLRHLLQMPNLNPKAKLQPTETPNPAGGYRPRMYFGQQQFQDLWLGEAQFLADKSSNLLRAALSGPVLLDFPDGSTTETIPGVFELAGYREVHNPLAVLKPGDWRFVKRDDLGPKIETYFKRNTYSWSMVGLTRDGRLLWLACRGVPGKQGYLLEEAAEEFRIAGAYNALLIDEGDDVFQISLGKDGQLEDNLAPRRHRMRAVFIVARYQPPAGGNPS